MDFGKHGNLENREVATREEAKANDNKERKGKIKLVGQSC